MFLHRGFSIQFFFWTIPISMSSFMLSRKRKPTELENFKTHFGIISKKNIIKPGFNCDDAKCIMLLQVTRDQTYRSFLFFKVDSICHTPKLWHWYLLFFRSHLIHAKFSFHQFSIFWFLLSIEVLVV